MLRNPSGIARGRAHSAKRVPTPVRRFAFSVVPRFAVGEVVVVPAFAGSIRHQEMPLALDRLAVAIAKDVVVAARMAVSLDLGLPLVLPGQPVVTGHQIYGAVRQGSPARFNQGITQREHLAGGAHDLVRHGRDDAGVLVETAEAERHETPSLGVSAEGVVAVAAGNRSEEHTSELQSHSFISYA